MLKIIKLTIILLLTFFLVVMFSLFSGIKVNSFSFGNFSISQLYIKLDKKLILEIEDMVFELKSTGVDNSAEDIQRNISKLPLIFEIFQKIDIERLKVKDNQFTISLTDKHLYLDSKYANFSGAIEFAEADVLFDVSSLYLKDLDLTLIGKLKMNVAKRIVNFFGDYTYEDFAGELNIQLTDDIFDFYINTTKSTKSLKFLKKFFRLDTVAEAWMYDNVTGDINLNYLYGKIDLNKKEAIMDSLKGQVVINDAKIRFHENAKTVDTKKLTIDYKDDVLSFDLDKPIYNKSKIYGSKVYITDLTSEAKGVVVVDLKTKEMLNKDILGILKAYDINLPLIQKKGKLDSSLVLRIPYLESKEMEVDGTFILNDATLRLNTFEFFAKKAKVILKDNIVEIKDSQMTHKDMLNANLYLKINTSNSTAKGNANIRSFNIGTKKEPIVKINGLKTKLDIDFKKNTKIDLKALKTKLDISDKKVNIDINDLSVVYPYSKLLKTIDIKKGDLDIDVIDKNNIYFKVNAEELDFPFEKNGKKLTKLSAKGSVKGKNTTISTNDSDIEIVFRNKQNPLLRLNNIDLVLQNDDKSSNSSVSFPNIDLELKNSLIKLVNNQEYKTEWANIHIKDSKVNFKGKALGLDLPISKNGKKVSDLVLSGTYVNDIVNVKTNDSKLELTYKSADKELIMNLDAYDVLYDSTIEESSSSNIEYYITGKNSNIIMNKVHLIKADTYSFIFENLKTKIDLKYKETKFEYWKDHSGKMYMSSKNMNDEFLNALLNKNLIKDGIVNLTANGADGVMIGKADLTNTKIIDLAILNNLLIFINTSPALINPLLAIPSVVGMATSGGFNLNGYRVIEGNVDFSYDFKNKYLNLNKIFTKGNGIDFDGYASIDFKSSKVDSKLKLVFLKDYSKIVGAIPVINYVLLGDEKRVDTQVEIYGTLTEPKYKTELAKEGVSAPVNFLKRVITSPLKIFNSFSSDEDKEDISEKDTKKDNK